MQVQSPVINSARSDRSTRAVRGEVGSENSQCERSRGTTGAVSSQQVLKELLKELQFQLRLEQAEQKITADKSTRAARGEVDSENSQCERSQRQELQFQLRLEQAEQKVTELYNIAKNLPH